MRGLEVSDVDDQRMVGGTPFRLEDPRDGSCVACIGAEAVDGFRRKRDEASFGQHPRGARDGGAVGAKDARRHAGNPRRTSVRRLRHRSSGHARRTRLPRGGLLEFMPLRDAVSTVACLDAERWMSEFLFTSESVSEGHPDKVADQISDAVLDAILEHDPTGRVAAETLVSTGLVVMAGEITTSANVDYARVARETIRRIGYNDPAAALRRRRLRRHGVLRPPVARHRAGRRPRVRRLPEPGRRRPGPDVRLRVRRDADADAVPDLLRASAGAAAERSAPRRPAAVAAARREIAGDGPLRRRQADERRHRRAVDAASSEHERQVRRSSPRR